MIWIHLPTVLLIITVKAGFPRGPGKPWPTQTFAIIITTSSYLFINLFECCTLSFSRNFLNLEIHDSYNRKIPREWHVTCTNLTWARNEYCHRVFYISCMAITCTWVLVSHGNTTVFTERCHLQCKCYCLATQAWVLEPFVTHFSVRNCICRQKWLATDA